MPARLHLLQDEYPSPQEMQPPQSAPSRGYVSPLVPVRSRQQEFCATALVATGFGGPLRRRCGVYRSGATKGYRWRAIAAPEILFRLPGIYRMRSKRDR
jgi:hypothetical protein